MYGVGCLVLGVDYDGCLCVVDDVVDCDLVGCGVELDGEVV